MAANVGTFAFLVLSSSVCVCMDSREASYVRCYKGWCYHLKYPWLHTAQPLWVSLIDNQCAD